MTTALLLTIAFLAANPAASSKPEASAADAPTTAAQPASSAPAEAAAAQPAPAAPEDQPATAAAPDAGGSGAASTSPAAIEPAPIPPTLAPPAAVEAVPAPTGPEAAEAAASATDTAAPAPAPAAAAAAAATPTTVPEAAAPQAVALPALVEEAASPAAPAAAAAAAAECPAVPECQCARPKRPTNWGLTLDGGFPDAAGVGLLYRPWYWLRLEAGGTTTVYASNGYRVGVSLVPFNFAITPALTFNYGRALETDWNPMLQKLGASDPDLEPVLRKFGYQYVDAHLGLELGAPRRFVFFVRAGLTQLWTTVHGLTAAAATAIEDASMSATISDTKITMRVPSVKFGFLVYFF